jgi:transposase
VNSEFLDENEALRRENGRLRETNARLKKLYDEVALELALLKKKLFGKKAEKIPAAQSQLAFALVVDAMARLADGDESAAADAKNALEKLRELDGDDDNGGDEDAAPKPAAAPKKAKRKPLPAELPVEEVVIEPADVDVASGAFEKIGEDISEHIDRRPASLVRVRVIRPKYRAKASTPVDAIVEAVADDVLPTTTISQAAMPDRVLPKSNAGPGLLAHVLVSKYADHLPLHRQEQMFKREGLRLSTSTMGDWVQGAASLLGFVVDAMRVDARQAPIVLSDATGVLVQAKEECARAHFYVVVVPRRSVLFEFTRVNDGATVAEILGGYSGKVQVDASSVYHELFRQNPDLVEVGCWAHARRKFFECLDVDRDRAMIGVGFIGLLYDAQNASIVDGVIDVRRRRESAVPILEKLKQWIEREREHGSGDAPIVKACNYVHNQWTPLTRFLDEEVRLDNNPAELELRRIAVGRKNWLFVGSDNGGIASAVVVSLMASCALHDLEPWGYLRDVLTVLPAWPTHGAIDLAPHNWRETLKKPETQRLLASQRLMGRHDAHVVDDEPKASSSS